VEATADGRWRHEKRQCNNQLDEREVMQQPVIVFVVVVVVVAVVIVVIVYWLR
jgi:hypothetical protein